MTPFMEELLFIKMRMEGADFDPVVEEVIEKNTQKLEENINLLRDRLLKKQLQVAEVENELLNDLVAVDAFEAANFQKGNIEETIHSLKPIVAELENKLASSENELQHMQKQTTLLKDDLNSLTEQLKKGKGKYYAFQDPLNQLSQKISEHAKNNGETS